MCEAMRGARVKLLKLVCATLLVGASGARALAAEGDNRKTPGPADAREATNSMKVAGFDEALLTALARRGAAAGVMCDGRDPVARRILNEYGAVFVAEGSVLPPPVAVWAKAEPDRARIIAAARVIVVVRIVVSSVFWM